MSLVRLGEPGFPVPAFPASLDPILRMGVQAPLDGSVSNQMHRSNPSQYRLLLSKKTLHIFFEILEIRRVSSEVE